MNKTLEKRDVIYVCTSSNLWREIATQLKNDYGFIPKFHVGFEERPTKNPNDIFYGIPFYNINHARRGDVPDTIPNFKLGPLDLNLFADIQDEFDTFLEMCERFVVDDMHGTFEQKKNFFLHLISVWTGILNYSKPKAVIIGSRPHRMFDFVLEILCKHQNLPFIMLEETDMNDCVYGIDIRKGLAFPFEKNRGERLKLVLSKEAHEFIATKRKAYREAKPVSISLEGYFSPAKQKRQQSFLNKIQKRIPPIVTLGWSIFKSCIKFTILQPMPTMIAFSKKDVFEYQPITPKKVDLLFQTYRRQKQMKHAINVYNANAIRPDLTKKYVYYSSSYQPERSTCPDAGRYHDMLLSLGVLSVSIDSGTTIYYKEHPRTFALPADFDAQRASWFYQEILRRYPNVKLIDNFYSPFDLIDNAYFVAMSSGTAALESAARGKYCILFGDRWFREFPGILSCYNTNDVLKAMKVIDNKKIELNDIYHYLSELENYSDDISHMFSSNIHFRKNVEQSISTEITDDEKRVNVVNAERAARQIHRATSFS